jgi:uncharacterized protein (DUF58 family)
VGFFVPVFFDISKVLLFILVVLTFVDIFILYNTKNAVTINRVLPERLSNGDENKITLHISNLYPFNTHVSIIEELPYQFQKRDFIFNKVLSSKEKKTIYYNLKPTERGIYNFGNSNVYASSPLQLATKKYVLSEEKEIKCYPSFLKLREFDFNAFSNNAVAVGTK